MINHLLTSDIAIKTETVSYSGKGNNSSQLLLTHSDQKKQFSTAWLQFRFVSVFQYNLPFSSILSSPFDKVKRK